MQQNTNSPAPQAPGDRQRPLFRRVLFLNLVLTFGLASAAVAVAFFAVGKAVEASARADIEAEIRILDQHGELQQGFGYANAIDFRILPEEDANSLDPHVRPELAATPSLSVYLLARSDMSPVVGNLAKWPDSISDETGWTRFDGADAGAAPGAIIAKVKSVHNQRFTLIVGRRLAAYDALYKSFLPVMIGLTLALAFASFFLTDRIARRFRTRVSAFNSVFRDVRSGSVDTRIAASMLQEGDELAALGSEINTALDEIARLMTGLDAVSQTAAHELNKEAARLRKLAYEAGEEELTAGADALLSLLREILELARINSTPGFSMRRIALAESTQEAADLYREAFEAKGVTLNVELTAPEAAVLGRATLITSMIANLLDNALKHTPEHGQVTLCVERRTNQVVLSVVDTGNGTDTDDIGELIRRGARGPIGGYGFGLRFVQAVAIRHGARLTIKHNHPGLSVAIAFPVI